MHEFSLASNVLKFCENELHKRPGSKIKKVNLLVGVMGGVDGNLLIRALDQLKAQGPFRDTEFMNENAPLIIRCRSCRCESRVEEILLNCPLCGEDDVELMGGQELLVKNIVFSEK